MDQHSCWLFVIYVIVYSITLFVLEFTIFSLKTLDHQLNVDEFIESAQRQLLKSVDRAKRMLKIFFSAYLISMLAFLSWELLYDFLLDHSESLILVDKLVFFTFGTIQLIWYVYYIVVFFKFYALVDRYAHKILMLKKGKLQITRVINMVVLLIAFAAANHFFLGNAITAFMYCFNS